MVYNKIGLLLLYLNLFFLATAQHTVRFTTIDVQTSKPLEDVSIIISKLKLAKTTNDAGYAFFTNIPPGIYDVAFSETGYEKQEIQFNFSNAYSDTAITVSLK